jgi:hypothetical protein
LSGYAKVQNAKYVRGVFSHVTARLFLYKHNVGVPHKTCTKLQKNITYQMSGIFPIHILVTQKQQRATQQGARNAN